MNSMAHQAGQRWQILFRRRVARGYDQHLADWDLLHVPAELSGKTVSAPEVSGVEAVHAGRVARRDRAETGAEQVDSCHASLGHVEHQVLLDQLPSVGIVESEAIGQRRAPFDLVCARCLHVE
jgi:hypothetical protein